MNVQKATMKVPDLNEDCVNEILSYLHVSDLCSIAEGYDLWKPFVESYFFRKYRKFDCSKVFKERPLMQQAKSIFVNFGWMIQSLRISINMFKNEFDVLMEDAAKYCGLHLEELHLIDLTMEFHELIKKFVSRCTQLRILEIKSTGRYGSDPALFNDIAGVVRRNNGIRLKIKIYRLSASEIRQLYARRVRGFLNEPHAT